MFISTWATENSDKMPYSKKFLQVDVNIFKDMQGQ